MGNQENLQQAGQDLNQMTQTKRGRRILLGVLVAGVILALAIIGFIKAC